VTIFLKKQALLKACEHNTKMRLFCKNDYDKATNILNTGFKNLIFLQVALPTAYRAC